MIFNVGAGGASTAESLKFDNSISGLTADNVQGAVDELSNKKVDKISGKGLSSNDYTTTEKNKLSGIATGANKTTVDTSLSTTSANPVQNKVVTAKLNELTDSLQNIDFTWREVNAITDIPTTANECMFIFKSNYNSYATIITPYALLDLEMVYTIFAFIWSASVCGYGEVKLTKNAIEVVTTAGGITSVETFKIYYR